MFGYSYRTAVARIAIFALLFSAASPAFAAFVLHDRAAMLGRMLQLPFAPHADAPPAVPAHASAHDHDFQVAHDSSAPPTEENDTQHAQHGIYCALCLTPSSVSALLTSSAEVAAFTIGASSFVATLEELFVRLLPRSYDARGPPALSRL